MLLSTPLGRSLVFVKIIFNSVLKDFFVFHIILQCAWFERAKCEQRKIRLEKVLKKTSSNIGVDTRVLFCRIKAIIATGFFGLWPSRESKGVVAVASDRSDE
jgi:hypothetical protein